MVSRIDRYLARRIATPLSTTLVIAFALLLIEELGRLLTVAAHLGGRVTLVWRMLAYLTPEYLSLALPVSALLGVLLAFRKLAENAELDVLQAIGLSYGRLLRAPYAYALALMAATLLISGFVQPVATYRFEELGFRLDTGASGAPIRLGEFNALGPRIMLRADRSDARSQSLYGIFAFIEETPGKSVAASAQQGTFMRADESGILLLRLANGRLIQRSSEYSAPRVLSFSRYDLPLHLPDEGAFRGRGSDNSELTLQELLERSRNAELASVRRSALAELNVRLADLAVFPLLPLLGLCLGVPPKRRNSALGVGLGVLILVAYYKLDRYALQLSSRGEMQAILAAWTPFFLLLLFTGRMYWIISRRAGGQPIRFLYDLAEVSDTLIRRPIFRSDERERQTADSTLVIR